MNIIIIISYILVFISYYNEINNTKNNKIADIFVLFIRFMHYYVLLVIIFYGYIFNKKYDFFYFSFLFFLIIKWLMIKDCILTYLEKKYYHNDICFDDSKYYNYYMYYLFFDYENIIFKILILIGIISFLIVIYRINISFEVKEKIIMFVIYTIYKLKKFKNSIFFTKI